MRARATAHPAPRTPHRARIVAGARVRRCAPPHAPASLAVRPCPAWRPCGGRLLSYTAAPFPLPALPKCSAARFREAAWVSESQSELSALVLGVLSVVTSACEMRISPLPRPSPSPSPSLFLSAFSLP
eukprot:3064729-Pleurochrysis_carterae.AAC.1